MSAGCFGLEVSDDEVRRWNTLAASGEPNFVTPWNRDHLRPIAGNALPAIQKAFLLAPLSEEDLSVPLLMEFGCGVGFHAPMALSQASAYVGIDISSLAVAMARYHFGNVEQARFLHSVFDRDAILDLRGTVGGIYGINFFYHQPAERLRAMIATAGELLGEGGWLLLDLLPEYEDIERSMDAPEGWQGGAGWTGFCVPYEQIAEAVAGAGFSGVTCNEHFFADLAWEPRRRHYVLCRKPPAGR